MRPPGPSVPLPLSSLFTALTHPFLFTPHHCHKCLGGSLGAQSCVRTNCLCLFAVDHGLDVATGSRTI